MKTIVNKGTLLSVNKSTLGETIEIKIQRIVSSKEPIKDGSPLIYTERNEGVLPAYDIRTDRFEIAIEAMDKVTMSTRAKRESAVKPETKPEVKPEVKSEGTPPELVS